MGRSLRVLLAVSVNTRWQPARSRVDLELWMLVGGGDAGHCKAGFPCR